MSQIFFKIPFFVDAHVFQHKGIDEGLIICLHCFRCMVGGEVLSRNAMSSIAKKGLDPSLTDAEHASKKRIKGTLHLVGGRALGTLRWIPKIYCSGQ